MSDLDSPTTYVTHYATAYRSPLAQVKSESENIRATQEVHAFFDVIPNALMVLNQHRQIVLHNKALLTLISKGWGEDVLGARPGEVLGCIHSQKMECGCGTSEFCKTCGALEAILEGLSGEHNYQECLITAVSDTQEEAIELGVTAIPLKVKGQDFLLLSLKDISDQKRRRILEKIFFHDMLNTVGSLNSLTTFLLESREQNLDEQTQELLQAMGTATAELLEGIEEQRDLSRAENNELQVSLVPTSPAEVVKKVYTHFGNHDVARGKTIALDIPCNDIVINSNSRLLYRVLCNMTKNALEATSAGQRVTLGYKQEGNWIRFWVNNPGLIPREVQLQLFQRSFSTKGSGRGLGTYSMKLLTERYLNGKISYCVAQGEGTTFTASYPLS